jgi:hypothetical protein
MTLLLAANLAGCAQGSPLVQAGSTTQPAVQIGGTTKPVIEVQSPTSQPYMTISTPITLKVDKDAVKIPITLTIDKGAVQLAIAQGAFTSNVNTPPLDLTIPSAIVGGAILLGVGIHVLVGHVLAKRRNRNG